jgi:hypothetical protein
MSPGSVQPWVKGRHAPHHSFQRHGKRDLCDLQQGFRIINGQRTDGCRESRAIINGQPFLGAQNQALNPGSSHSLFAREGLPFKNGKSRFFVLVLGIRREDQGKM